MKVSAASAAAVLVALVASVQVCVNSKRAFEHIARIYYTIIWLGDRIVFRLHRETVHTFSISITLPCACVYVYII